MPTDGGAISATTAACADDQEELRRAADLLPPDRLVLCEDTVKVTFALSRRSVAFLQRDVAKWRVQRMIGAFVDAHARRLGGEQATARGTSVGGAWLRASHGSSFPWLLALQQDLWYSPASSVHADSKEGFGETRRWPETGLDLGTN